MTCMARKVIDNMRILSTQITYDKHTYLRTSTGNTGMQSTVSTGILDIRYAY